MPLMVRFSCFQAHTPSPKPKKIFQPSVEAMNKSLQDSSKKQAFNLKDLSGETSLKPSQAEGTSRNLKHLLSLQPIRKSDDNESNCIDESSLNVTQTGRIIKSRSLGSALNLEGRLSVNSDAEDDTDQGYSDGSNEHNRYEVPDGRRGVSPPEQCQSSEVVNDGSIFSIGDQLHSEKEGQETSDTALSGEFGGNCGVHMPRDQQGLVKSRSLPNITDSTPATMDHSHLNHLAVHSSRSSQDLHVLGVRRKEISVNELGMQVMQEHKLDDIIARPENHSVENSIDDGYDSCNYSGLAKDWIMPESDEANRGKNIQGESSVHRWDELPSRDFKIKRIEEWVSGLQHSSPLEETNEASQLNEQEKRDSGDLNSVSAAKTDVKVTPGMEAAKRYISALSATSSAAQLANHGLAVIPFLSAFVNLRVVNLSGNAIVRITAGALPRGLHMLNLSKNNIANIEGLRELTRLRVLDLSYNRILRIGHGLASCSSLKELYLAGNKISEVEGLHRLLKLAVLDLRFNKISTAKCLGQLAANYNSLQAISLEGNPAQKNVGDDHLKKYLQGLLPHMAYYNRQPIKSSTLKDSADRSVRLGSTHQFDRGLRPDHKATRKGTHGASAHRASSSSTHGHANQSVLSLKKSRGRHGHLPPTGTKPTTSHTRHHYDIGNKLMNLKQDLSMRRTRSEGTMAAM
ncbi:hypothetical protein ACLB2K_054509 [Fragaria x ananassa]|uniref:uncharacterized protein LOC101298578 n=1 Tax=Fragaria vesca subsp. vesca TaxID=101020 RepID=UPI0005CAFCB1|nr:PREDICTED: uncharacterized protein LOC101298578 [Fragaria vesca subsp. vesca]